jgi:hypothetical protein
LIATLPKSWDNFTSSFMGVQGGNKRGSISTMQLILMLKSEYIRRVGDDKIRGDQTYRTNVGSHPSKRKRDGDTCTICNYDNHTTNDCHWKCDGGYCTQCKCGGHWTSNCWGKNGKGKGKAREREKDMDRDKPKANKKKARANAARSDDARMDIDNDGPVAESSNHVNMDRKSNRFDWYWLADSGTTSHIAIDRDMFSTYTAEEQDITGVGKESVMAIGRGTVILTSQVGDKTYEIALHDTHQENRFGLYQTGATYMTYFDFTYLYRKKTKYD